MVWFQLEENFDRIHDRIITNGAFYLAGTAFAALITYGYVS
ncbi:hypothetical protein [Candidatus Azobacteroides pseudotrichonymphae]|nr:hypothetical protein [Candidatus Azobacteroides pseudotrichonymphae]